MTESHRQQAKKRVLMLITKMGLNRDQVQNQQRALHVLQAKHIPFETLDGSDPTNKDKRNELFQLSGIRGSYPQFFLVDDNTGVVSFLGDYDKLEALNDASCLPDDILDANPDILTWDKLFG